MNHTLLLQPGPEPCLQLGGDWTLKHYRQLRSQHIDSPDQVQRIDAQALTALDTAGATVLLQLLGAERLRALVPHTSGLSAERQALLLAVADAMAEQREQPPQRGFRFGDGLAALGQQVLSGWQQLIAFLNFLGLTLVTLIALLPRPWRWRMTALVAQMHQAGLNAVPIVAVLNFLVGAVVAFLGATVLTEFGATIYTVDLVAYAFMRELGVLLAAILLAGRTASAFTAQIGSMKVNEELDALKVHGMSAIEMLVLPRLLALLITLPMLAFVAILSGIAGGAVVSVLTLDISLTRYIGIVQEVPVKHLLLGLSKAPFFAVLIALIGCLEGFKVAGSAQSLGERTTSAVVQSIFVVILVNAIAALFFMEMGW
ncbi:ABC transporter permease [Pseudohongiella acticola]|jgi:phospholipid/cholesterol/gamma-HCH transport system permease protein|uniref:MlaE family ABC transporter permease n=1 Tax=Pseudohongiella acticola TaxID=1524254 RepID=UPI0030EEA97D